MRMQKEKERADVRKTGNKEGYKEAHPTGTRSGGNLSAAYAGVDWNERGINKRSVWTVPTHPYPEAHFATFPEALIEPMVLAGAPKGGVVLDPFGGAMTTCVVAKKLGRNFLAIELNEKYIEIGKRRLAGTPVPMIELLSNGQGQQLSNREHPREGEQAQPDLF